MDVRSYETSGFDVTGKACSCDPDFVEEKFASPKNRFFSPVDG